MTEAKCPKCGRTRVPLFGVHIADGLECLHAQLASLAAENARLKKAWDDFRKIIIANIDNTSAVDSEYERGMNAGHKHLLEVMDYKSALHPTEPTNG